MLIFAAKKDMEALQYEHLIRTAYQCERDDVYGANADIYTQMDYAFDILSDNHWGNKGADKEFNFRNKFQIVKKCVSSALKTGANKICYEATAAEIETLDGFITELQSDDFLDKHRLDAIIADALTIFEDNGMTI